VSVNSSIARLWQSGQLRSYNDVDRSRHNVYMLLVQVSVSNDSGHPGACKAVLEVEYRGEAADPTAGRMRRVAAAKARHNVNWTEPSGGDVDDGAEYRMEFGKYSGGKGLTVQQVQTKDPGYFKHLMSWRTSILVTYPRLKDALEESGLLEALVTARPELQREKAELVLMRAEDRASRQERGPKEHPEIFKKRRLQQIEASSVLTGQQKDDAMALAAASARPTTKKKQKERKYEAKPSTLLGHCSRCGGIGHNRTTCKLKDLQGDGIPQQTLIEWAYEQNKTLAALISRLKYTNISGRSDMYEQRPHQRSRAASDDTVEVELDATVVFKWKVRDQVSGVVTFYYYCPLVE
jgi:hypothetical protein